MFGIEQLNNTGIKYIGDESALHEKRKTLVVVGVARGGTSLISGCLDHLGVFSGDLSDKPVFEDVRLANAFETNNAKLVNSIIEEYDQNHKIWSFKRPSSIGYMDRIDELFHNPIYLFVFKDVFSISNRNNISMKLDTINGLVQAHENYGEIIKFISKTKVNAFLFSYEKIVSNKEVFVDTLIDMIGKEVVTDDHRSSALGFIQPNSKEYLNASRITKSVGKIGFVDKFRVIGWGKYSSSEEAAKAELYVNEKLRDVVLAKDFREHVQAAKIHSTGNCGYIFNLNNQPLLEGDKVSVKLSDDVMFLENSDQIFKP